MRGKVNPPIETCDGVVVKDGMSIYYVTECCSRDSPHVVEQGQVIAVDLGRRREVRVRKVNGREVVLSMSSNRGMCSVDGVKDREVIFGRKAKAVTFAKELSAGRLRQLQERLDEAKKEADVSEQMERAAGVAGLRWAKRDLKQAKDRLANYKAAVSKIGK